MTRRFLFAMSSVALGLLACQAIVGVRPEEGRPLPSEAGTSDPCVKRRPPPRPDVGPVSAPPPPRFYAVRTFRVSPAGAPPIGYDLDGHCTSEPGSTSSRSSCAQRGEAGDAGDGDGGLDNAFGRIAGVFNGSLSNDLAGETFTESTGKGIFTLLVQVLGYNGLPDDDDVDVAIITSNDVQSSGCNDGGPGPPSWDGCDVWSYVEGTVTIQTPSRETVAAAVIPGYVKGGVLVATGSDGPREIGLGATTFTLIDPLVTATFRTNDRGIPVLADGVLTGRVSPADLLDFAARLEIDAEPLCENGALIEAAVTQVCAARDLALAPADDQRSPPAPCDALSFAFGFEAEQARLGTARAPRDAGAQCAGFAAQCPD